MNRLSDILQTPKGRVAVLGLGIVTADQASKLAVIKLLQFHTEKSVIPGFFKLVHWGNTGAAWSLFTGNNHLLTIVACIALVVLYLARHHFDARSPLGQVAFGLLVGGIVGNLIDRVRVGHVIDFLYFYLPRRDGGELGFPAFNIADSAICVGVALIFLNTWRGEAAKRTADTTASG